jgi:NCAIR mutase (PurE)-related protein
MEVDALEQLLAEVATGVCSPEEAVTELRRLPFADLGFARVDHHRRLRQGLPEAVYGPGKTPEQVAAIVVELLSVPSTPVVLTRATKGQVAAATQAARDAGHPEAKVTDTSSGASETALVTWRPFPERPQQVLVVTAGTADLPVASEAHGVLEALGFRPRRLTDCGVAGLHRLLGSVAELGSADAVVVVAGMEGALASVVGGLTGAPVVAVPTSVGYGAGLEGVTALLSMLSSCAAGVTVVGIDNGFGAACAVARLLR